MSQLTRQRVRLAVDTARFDQLKELRTSEAPQFWRGDDVAFEAGLFRGADLLDISNFVSLTLEVKTNDSAGIVGTPLMSRTVSGAGLNTALSSTTWADESQQHALFAFSGAETALDLGGELEKVFYFALSGLTTDVPVRRLTLGYGLLKVREGGVSGLPPMVAANNGNFRLKNGNELQLRDTTASAWRSLWFANGTIQVGAPES